MSSGRVGLWEFDGLAEYYPDARSAASSSSYAVYTLTLALFSDLPARARLFLEVPDFTPLSLSIQKRLMPGFEQIDALDPMYVQQIRAWSFWENGPEAGLPINSHHENPDGSMCVCLPQDWMRGRDNIIDYVAFCACWIANSMFHSAFGFYPGTQHMPASIRRARSRLNEFCGCGERRLYHDCCWQSDQSLTQQDLVVERSDTRRRYYAALAAQNRVANPLAPLGRITSPSA